MTLDRTSLSFILVGSAIVLGARALTPASPACAASLGCAAATPPPTALATAALSASTLAGPGGEACAAAAKAAAAAPPASAPTPKFRTAVLDPKPLSEQVRKGLAWLIAHQLPSGGWGQGDHVAPEATRGPAAQGPTPQGSAPAEEANVGDTGTAILALLRSGAPATDADSAAAMRRGASWLCERIEASDDTSMALASPQGTRLQSKLGPFIDTFVASLALSECRGHLADAAAEARADAALRKVLRKIESNQRQDGTWGGEGWAPVLAESVAAKGINRAAQSEVAVADVVFQRVNEQAQRELAQNAGFGGAGNAGVALYAGASNLGKLQDASTTLVERKEELVALATASPASPEAQKAQSELASIEQVTASCDAMRASLIARLDDPGFVAGFGSNGGEEFLSYLNIGESLVVAGGDAWSRWDAAMTSNLNRIQNADGSWTGHHCITGRTFCTASALMVLTADRTPVPQ